MRNKLTTTTNTIFLAVALFCASGVHAPAVADTPDLKAELTAILHDFDSATYDTPNNEAQAKAFESIRGRAAALATRYPGRAEPLAWQAWALMGQAGAVRNFSAMAMMNEALEKLEAASAIPSSAYAAAIHSSLGGMYANAPGFPMSFGDKKKAHANYQKSLALNPNSVDSNFNYAKFLFDSGDYVGALKHASVSANAPPRPGREKSDSDFHAKAEALIAQAKAKLQ